MTPTCILHKFTRLGPVSGPPFPLLTSENWWFDGDLPWYTLQNHLLLVAEPTHLKNMSQIGNLPQIGVKIIKYLKPTPTVDLI